MGSERNWNKEEVDFLRDNWQTTSDEEIAKILSRSVGGVKCKRKKLRLLKDQGHRKYSYEDVVLEFAKTKYELVSGAEDYYDAAQNTLKYICPDHRDKGIFTISLGHLQNGRGCPYCGRERTTKARQSDLTDNKYREACEQRGLQYINTIRENGKIYVEYICPNHKDIGMQRMYYWNLLRIDQGCAFCHKSEWENFIRLIFVKLGILYETEKEFDGLIDVRPLRFDFYLPEYQKVIEYDGRHHFEPINFNGISESQALKEFDDVKRRDKLKNDYCYNHHIPLLRIPYYEFDHAEQMIKDFVF